MITIRQEKPADGAAREALLDAAYGPVRFTKTSAQLRAGNAPARGLALAAFEGKTMVGTVRLWPVEAAGGRSVLLLGPLAVDAGQRNRGIGAALMQRALHEAKRRGHDAVVLVGDAAYYSRFGFSAEKTGGLWLPGPYEQHRLLAVELVPGALDGIRGLIRVPKSAKPARTGLVAAARHAGFAVQPQ